MQVIRDNQPSDNSKRSVVTIGAYDGVHRGHQAVIGEVISRARAAGLPITWLPDGETATWVFQLPRAPMVSSAQRARAAIRA